MIDFIDYTGCKTYLVAVGRIPGGGGLNYFSLGKLSLNCFADGFKRIRSSGNAHRAVNVSPA